MITGPSRRMRELVIARDRELCRRCYARAEQIHHRRPRQAGGSRDSITNSAPNLVLLCRSCHEWVESYRTEAYEKGWLVHRWEQPAATPVIDLLGQTSELMIDKEGQ